MGLASHLTALEQLKTAPIARDVIRADAGVRYIKLGEGGTWAQMERHQDVLGW